MAKSSADDSELRRACENSIEGTNQKVVLSIRVDNSRGIWGKLGHHMDKPRVVAISKTLKGRQIKAYLQVLKYSTGGVLETAKSFKLKHLSKVEVLANDPSGFVFTLWFDNLRNHDVTPQQWTLRNINDRDRLLLCILTMCDDALGRLPKVVGIDVVEMALWAKENASKMPISQRSLLDVPVHRTVTESDLIFNAGMELVSRDEKEDMEALLDTYVKRIGQAEAFSERLRRELLALEAANMHAILESAPLVEDVLQGLEAAASCVEDMEEWLGIFSVKMRHMMLDIESIEARNNKLEMQSVNDRSLVEEVDKLVALLHVPSNYESCLTGGSFDADCMLQNNEACEWLTSALSCLEAPKLDPTYATIQAVKEKRKELEKLKMTFVKRASDFLKHYFSSLVEFMISDRSYVFQGRLKRPDHTDLRYRCRIYARLLQHLKSLDKNCLGLLRKAYCCSLNLLLCWEAREFANELQASAKVSRNPTVWLEVSGELDQSVKNIDTSTVSDAYAKMLRIFVPLIVDEISFFTRLMCFEVPMLNPLGGLGNDSKMGVHDDLGIIDIDDNDIKSASSDLLVLNEFLHDLLNGIQEDFYAVLDWAYEIDPLRCILMHGVTECYIHGQKADISDFVHILLYDLKTRISTQFSHYVDEACHQIERSERCVRQMSVLSYMSRFAIVATQMEQYILGQSRDLVDQAYTKVVSTMFGTLKKIAQTDPKSSDIFLLVNYGEFQNSLYYLANIVPTLSIFYQQAKEAYEQACTDHISMIIFTQFERLFQFGKKIEDLMFTIPAEEGISFQLELSKQDLREMLNYSLSGLDSSINAMYRRLQKSLPRESQLLPSLWDKCKKIFLEKYENFVRLVAKVYPDKSICSVSEMRDLLASFLPS